MRQYSAVFADLVEAVWTGSARVEDTSEFLFTAGALWLSEQLLLEIALFLELLS